MCSSAEAPVSRRSVKRELPQRQRLRDQSLHRKTGRDRRNLWRLSQPHLRCRQFQKRTVTSSVTTNTPTTRESGTDTDTDATPAGDNFITVALKRICAHGGLCASSDGR